MSILDQYEGQENIDYLGDAVYVGWDGYHIVLTTNDGINVTNTICLDSHVIASLERYLDEHKRFLNKPKEETF